MKKLFNKQLSQSTISPYIGDMSQIAGATPIEYQNGKSRGVKAIQVKTGSGLLFNVLADRALDISYLEYAGIPLSWVSKVGIVNPYFFENGGLGLLRSFNGGMVTTCGLTHVGNFEKIGDEVLGIHDRISHIPAENVSISENWENDDYHITIKGRMRQSCLYAENLVLDREITTKLGDCKFKIKDTITNEGGSITPFMLLYHLNFGFPVVSEDSKLIKSESISTEPWINSDGESFEGIYERFEKPIPDYKYQLFSHKIQDQNHPAYFGIINESISFGGYVKLDPKQFPSITQWKMMGYQDYTVAIEPGNAKPEGRTQAKANNRLEKLEPGETRKFELELGVLPDLTAIQQFNEKL